MRDEGAEETRQVRAMGRRGRWALGLGGLLLLGAAVILLLYGNDLLDTGDAGNAESLESLDVGTPTNMQPPVSIGPAPQPGELAPPFLLADLNGTEVTLAQFRGQKVILNFWATWCAPCIFEMPELQAAYEAYDEDGLIILGLNRDEDQQVVADFLANDLETEVSFPILLDDHALVADSYGVLNMPTTYFINADGVVSAVHRGPLTREQIDALLADMS